MSNKVIYNEYQKATGRFIAREAEVCGPVATDTETGDKFITIGVADVVHNIGGMSHATHKRPYQNLRVNFAKPGGAPQWRQVDGVSQASEYFNAAGKSHYVIVPASDAPNEPSRPTPKTRKGGTTPDKSQTSGTTPALDPQSTPPAPPAPANSGATEPSGPPIPPVLASASGPEQLPPPPPVKNEK